MTGSCTLLVSCWLILILLAVPSCRPQGDGPSATRASPASEGSYLMAPAAPNRTHIIPMSRPMNELEPNGTSVGTPVTVSSVTSVTSAATVMRKTAKDDTIMIQYRRFQRPQRRDLPSSQESEAASPACEQFMQDEMMADKSIVFKSPNYPYNYPNNTDCVRRLTADPGFLLQLDFRDTFHIEPSEDCRFDYLEVRDGAHGYSTLRGQFCGQTFPPMLTSTDRYLWLRFHSDENIEYSGFRAVYRFVPRPTSEHAQPEMEMCHINVTGSQGHVNRSDIDRLKPERVNMTESHRLSLDCMWVIQVEEGWKIHLHFINFKLEKPNDCESNFVDVFSTRTDLPSRLKNFCGSIADAVTSETNVLHVRFYADYSARSSTFESLFTAYREKASGATPGVCDKETEFDCEDNTCIRKSLRCNGVHNCRFKWDEDECKPKSGSFADIISSSDQLIIIMVIFCLLVFGMCFAFVYNCVGKLLRDHRIIQEHMRQSQENRLDEMGRKSPSMTLVGVGVATKARSLSRQSHSRHHSSEHDPDGELTAENTPTARRHHHQDCFLSGTDDAVLPMLISRGTIPSAPANGEAIFAARHHMLHQQLPDPEGSLGDEELGGAGGPLGLGLPEMRDSECQTRESLFHNNNSSLSNHNTTEPSRSNSERSNTPPPPPPPALSRLINMKNSRNAPTPFSTFGYTDRTVPRRVPPAPTPIGPADDPLRFRAEAVIEMDQKSNSTSGSSGPGAGPGGGAPQERPFSIDSTKSAPDVIVTH